MRELITLWTEQTPEVLSALGVFFAQHDRLSEQFQASEHQVEGLQQQLTTLRTAVANLEAERSALSSVASALERECSTLRAERDVATQSVVDLLHEHARSIGALAQKFGIPGIVPSAPVPERIESAVPAAPPKPAPAPAPRGDRASLELRKLLAL